MIRLKLRVTGANEDELKKALVEKADRYFGDRKYRFIDLDVTVRDWRDMPDSYEAEGVALPYNPPTPPTVPEDDDPFGFGHPLW